MCRFNLDNKAKEYIQKPIQQVLQDDPDADPLRLAQILAGELEEFRIIDSDSTDDVVDGVKNYIISLQSQRQRCF